MAKKDGNPFLKKAAGPKPQNRRAMKRGLGDRGLEALSGVQLAPRATAFAKPVSKSVAKPAAGAKPVPETASPAPANGGVVLQVPPLDIARCPWQPRMDFNDAALDELAASIKANGVIQPLVCRRREDGKLELIAGERRLRASVRAGLKLVPVVLKDANDRKAAEMVVIENIQRFDLNVIEEAEGYRLLKEQFGLIQEDVADRVGKSRSAVANSLRLLDLPDEVKQLLSQNLISTGHAKVLLSVPDDTARVLLARDCVTDGLTVRALERKVALRNRPKDDKPSTTPDFSETHARGLTDALRRQLGCAVRLTAAGTLPNGRRVKGRLEVDFVDNNDLDRVLSMIGVRMD